jgi:hypothetical protein
MAVSTPSRFLLLRWLAEARDAFASVLIPAPCRLRGELLTDSSRIPVCEGCLDVPVLTLRERWGGGAWRI